MALAETVSYSTQLILKCFMNTATHDHLPIAFGQLIFVVGASIDLTCLYFDFACWLKYKNHLDSSRLSHTDTLDGAFLALFSSIVFACVIFLLEILLGGCVACKSSSTMEELRFRTIAWLFDILSFLGKDFPTAVCNMLIVDECYKQGVDETQYVGLQILFATLMFGMIWGVLKTIVNFKRVFLLAANQEAKLYFRAGFFMIILQNFMSFVYLSTTVVLLGVATQHSSAYVAIFSVYYLYTMSIFLIYVINVILFVMCLCCCKKALRLQFWNGDGTDADETTDEGSRDHPKLHTKSTKC